MNNIIQGDSLEVLKEFDADSVDLLCTDPPYGYSFMGKSWDKTLPDIGIFKECLRVLKPGAFAFVMSAPRSDVCARMMLLLEDAGFSIGFTPLYWTYASGFPKAMNIGKMVDKRRWGGKTNEIRHYLRDVIKASGVSHKKIKDHLGIDQKSGVVSNWTVTDSAASVPSSADWLELKNILPLDTRYDDLILEAEREVVGQHKFGASSIYGSETYNARTEDKMVDVSLPETAQAKALDGSYGGFQPKPAVEVIIVAMKPLSEKTFVDQALKNGKGITWLDDCRVPTGDSLSQGASDLGYHGVKEPVRTQQHEQGRFPANLIVSDDVLNDGRVIKGNFATSGESKDGHIFGYGNDRGDEPRGFGDSGSYSRYFDLDAWSKTLPFLIVHKASKSEKGKNCTHPTVKPLKLMQYLITLGSRPGDVVLDPFAGSGTTGVAAKQLNRNYLLIEREKEYVDIAEARLNTVQDSLFAAVDSPPITQPI